MDQHSKILNFKKNKKQQYLHALDLYDSGEHKQALELAIDLINNGDEHANTLAGTIYEKGGNYVEQDIDKSIFYYQKAIEEVGALEAWLALGRIYYFGKGVNKDYQQAFYYYSSVDKDLDNGVANLMLGKMYLNGHGVEKDLSQARTYFGKAISLGYVYGYTNMALLEQEKGNSFKSIYLRIKAAFLGVVLSIIDSEDMKLRQW